MQVDSEVFDIARRAAMVMVVFGLAWIWLLTSYI